MKHDLPSFAVLIDADNVRIDTISLILEEITRHGRVTVRRIYGDFTTPNLAGWRTKLAEHALQPIQQYRNTTGKNASDSALIIDAMDLLHSRRFEGFGLVSSDSDFTRLATRIREDGLFVFGFGEKHAPKAFVNACERYIYVENLIAPPPLDSSVAAPVAEIVEPVPCSVPAVVALLSETFVPEAPAKLAFKPPTLAVKILLKAYSNVADEQGWAMLGQLSSKEFWRIRYSSRRVQTQESPGLQRGADQGRNPSHCGKRLGAGRHGRAAAQGPGTNRQGVRVRDADGRVDCERSVRSEGKRHRAALQGEGKSDIGRALGHASARCCPFFEQCQKSLRHQPVEAHPHTLSTALTTCGGDKVRGLFVRPARSRRASRSRGFHRQSARLRRALPGRRPGLRRWFRCIGWTPVGGRPDR